MGEHDLDQRIRLVTLGGPGVGKTCIIKRFLFNTYCDKYKATVEDLYYREYDIGSVTIKVDILDTAGDLQFPAMRRLSIATANAFLLVYAVTNAESFDMVKQVFEEIKEQRADFQEIPILVVGNKMDLPAAKKEVRKEDVAEWVYCELPKLKAKVVECSAKENIHVLDIFRAFLQLADIPKPGDGGVSLKRRSSAYGSIPRTPEVVGGRLSPNPLSRTSAELDIPEEPTGNRLKPRSRSLIRRSSKKSPKMGRSNTNVNSPEGCITS